MRGALPTVVGLLAFLAVPADAMPALPTRGDACSESVDTRSPHTRPAALRISDAQFDRVALTPPALAEALTWISAVDGGRGGAFDLRGLTGFAMGVPGYERAWAARRDVRGEAINAVAGPPSLPTRVLGSGSPEPGQERRWVFSLSARRAISASSPEEVLVERVDLVLAATDALFASVTTDVPVRVYEVVEVRIPGLEGD